MKWIVTGGMGFIGSAMCEYLHRTTIDEILVIDALTYAANTKNLAGLLDDSRVTFIHSDMMDVISLEKLINDFQPNVIMHFAAESHVDNSISSPAPIVRNNILSTLNLLEAFRKYVQRLAAGEYHECRLHHISTDEVFGDLGNVREKFCENSQYNPSSPYSASKASCDHLVKAWYRTYGLPIVISNCSNNYGPRQLPEKLIPVTINKILQGQSIPIYGDGKQIRDWLFVEDHVNALYKIAKMGRVGESYTVGGNCELSNLELIDIICNIMDDKLINKKLGLSSCKVLKSFVSDRPGHDRRYAVNSAKVSKELNWNPEMSIKRGLEQTVQWYIENPSYWGTIC
ncbi:MAG: dTDP-glucose 4,6-dehydratase [Aestuariibacter sp.]